MDGLENLSSLFGGGGGSGGGIMSLLGLGGGGDSGGAPLWQKILTGGMLGGGEIGNLIEEHKRAQYQNLLMSLIKDPAKLTQMILKAQRPLDNSLVQSVNNRVQGDMASRGLAQAPGIFAASEAQALAPFEQQNYNTALQQVMQSLGLPAGTFQQPQNMSPLMMQFLKMFPSGGGGGGATGGIPHDPAGADPLPGLMYDWNNPALAGDFGSTQPGGG